MDEDLMENIADLHRRSQQALIDSDFAAAATCSDSLRETLAAAAIEPVVPGDGQARPYSVLVVAHRPAVEHGDLLSVLLDLDPDRFEIILVENSAERIFPREQVQTAGNVRVVALGQNLGIGIARSIGFLAARGDGVICIDDDGHAGPSDIEALISTFTAYAATAVRGRVLPRTEGAEVRKHYDLGNRVTRTLCDIEGMAIWNRRHVLEAGGFDPILYGHEGADLSTRLYPLHGPDAFLYEPAAVLRHDYAPSPEKLEEKTLRYGRINGYLEFRRPNYPLVKAAFRRGHGEFVPEAMLAERRSYASAGRARLDADAPAVSILTTCRNGASFIESYLSSLDRQTDRRFEIVFVDDGSDDDSVARIKALCPGDIPLRLLQSGGRGRAAALNQALEAATGDICLIADVDDISIPHRVAWTRDAYRRHPDADMIGFMIFDDRNPVRGTRPYPIGPVQLGVRSFFGMPCPFPAFSFRRLAATERFDETLQAGLDCDWLFRLIVGRGVRGVVLPLNLVYYKLHDGQITASKWMLQQTVSFGHLTRLHDLALGTGVPDPDALALFIGREPVRNPADHRRVSDYALRIATSPSLDPSLAPGLRVEMARHLDAIQQTVLKQDCARARKAVAARVSELASARERISAVQGASQAEKAALQNQLKSAKAAEKRANDRAAEAERVLALVNSSRSWRLTGPLRIVGRVRQKLRASLREPG